MIELDSENFEREALNSIRPCIVKFHNNGCHLCAGLHPVFARLQEKYGQSIKFASLDTWKNFEIAEPYLDGGVPTIQIFAKDYAPVLVEYPDEPTQNTGYPEDYLANWIYNYLLSYFVYEAKKKNE